MQSFNMSVSNLSIVNAGITKDFQDALCEFIWNGYEANATEVKVESAGGDLSTSMEITICDNGTGINFYDLKNTFGEFLSSGKRHKALRIKSQENKGKGRFSYIALSHTAEWDTVFFDGNVKKQYLIRLVESDKPSVAISEPQPSDNQCGTCVRIPIGDKKIDNALAFDAIEKKLLENFAWYLYLNRHTHVKLYYYGHDIDYSKYINEELSMHEEVTIGKHQFYIDVIVWKSKIENVSKIYFLNKEGEVCDADNTSYNRNTIEFHHGVFVRSDYFTAFPCVSGSDEMPLLELPHQDENRQTMKDLRKKILSLLDETLHGFLLLHADNYLHDLEEKHCYPNFDDDEYGQAKKRDFHNVTRELYCTEPRIFFKLKPRQTKSLLGFLALLLDSNERENVLEVIEQVASLDSEQRAKFASILKRTKLEHMIDVVDIIQKRYKVVSELRNIVYDKELSHFANERAHIQKIIENHYWLFGDQYQLVTADVTIKRSLEQFEKAIASSDDTSMLTPAELRQRMDILLYAGRMTEAGDKECLVIELKAPSVVLNPDVFSQIQRYANLIRKEPQFSAQGRRWKFFAVCSSIDDDIKIKFETFAANGKPGLADIIGNFEIYALTWDDIFLSFERRYQFILDKLKRDFEETDDNCGEQTASRELIEKMVQEMNTYQLPTVASNF